MKPSELRRGNRVLLGKPVIVDEIYSTHFKTTEGGFVAWDQPDLSGIQLTEEWLKKFGFTKQGELNYTRYWHKNPDALFSFGNYARSNDDPESKPTLKARCKDGQTNQVSIASLKYVHQLQNLYFALTGEELKCA